VKPVVTGDKLTLASASRSCGRKSRASKKAIGDAYRSYRLRPERSAHIGRETPVPFLPTVANEAAHLIQPGRVPCFGNDWRRPGRVRFDIPRTGGLDIT